MMKKEHIDADPHATEEHDAVRKLRLWPAFSIISLQVAVMFGPQILAQFDATSASSAPSTTVEPGALDNPQTVLNSKLLGPALGTLLLFLWWVVASKATWLSRLVVPVAFTGIAWLTWITIDSTMMFAFFMFVIPCATSIGVISLHLFRRLAFTKRGLVSIGFVVATFAGWAQFRMEGVDGDLNSEFALRWTKTDEQRFLAENKNGIASPATLRPKNLRADVRDSPEFRGLNRDGIIRNETIQIDWPEEGLPEIWRRKVGPGWSSFAVVDDWIFTQEQRGDEEVVAAYDATNGESRWVQRTKARFTETISGVGPRATPTFSKGMLYTTGASGDIHCLAASTGEVLWRRDLIEDTGAYLPMWGFSSSPLVIDDRVIVFAGGDSGKALIAYNSGDGTVLWQSGDGSLSYSSPQMAVIHDTVQVLMATEEGVASFDPTTGKQLWNHEWELGGGASRIVQPRVQGNDIIIGTGYGLGTRRIAVSHEENAWSTEVKWTSLALKPYFNDFVLYGEYIFGFDKNIFTCVELATGKRKWKRGRYGHGQVLLSEDQGILLVLSEKGDLVLLRANSSTLEELHRFNALDGKTWNHPVVSSGRLFIRNGVEAACFDISPKLKSN